VGKVVTFTGNRGGNWGDLRTGGGMFFPVYLFHHGGKTRSIGEPNRNFFLTTWLE
jgi:hypothetical protein